jgi:hypothetical protein
MPTAHTSLGETALTALSDASKKSGTGTRVQVLPFQCRLNVCDIPAAE